LEGCLVIAAQRSGQLLRRYPERHCDLHHQGAACQAGVEFHAGDRQRAWRGTSAATSAATAAASGTASATGAVGASSGGFLASLFGSGAAAVIHAGGVVGVTQLPQRNVSWFDRAPRYHTGGVVGLAANEQAAILQRGEEVLTADNPRNMRNMTNNVPRDINIRNVLVADPELVPQHMASSRGEKIIMSTLTRNAATVRQLVR
jgi:hypothetical protein